jgi:hypothetical protein
MCLFTAECCNFTIIHPWFYIWYLTVLTLLLKCINRTPWGWPLKSCNIMLIYGILIYVCICRYLFGIVILLLGYEQDKFHNYPDWLNEEG